MSLVPHPENFFESGDKSTPFVRDVYTPNIRKNFFDEVLAQKVRKESFDEGMQKGIIKGALEGEQIGIAKGRAECQIELTKNFAIKLLKKGTSVSEISELTGLPEEEIRQLD